MKPVKNITFRIQKPCYLKVSASENDYKPTIQHPKFHESKHRQPLNKPLCILQNRLLRKKSEGELLVHSQVHTFELFHLEKPTFEVSKFDWK